MHGYDNNSIIAYNLADSASLLPPLLDVMAPLQNFPSPPTPPLVIPAAGNEFSYSYSSSGCSSYGSPSSLTTSYSDPRPSLMQRSVSSHSFQKNTASNGIRQLVSTSPAEFMDSETSLVRRVFSTGDLQRINGVQHYHRSESPLSNENSIIIEGMSKACRYSPEEKRDRIEKYKSKRTQRNFNKKIKYECRKTLADSRPRIRGRFARNEEIDKSSQSPWSHMDTSLDEYDDEENWIDFLDSFTANQIP